MPGLQKKRKTDANCNTMANHKDRLGGLTDDQLLHILSFLPLDNAISTSRLSKRWRFLWTRMTTLDFRKYDNSNFINMVLVFHNGFKIRSFKIDLSDHLSSDEEYAGSDSSEHYNRFADCMLNSWLYFATSRFVEELSLVTYQNSLPHHLFHCQSVTDMELGCKKLNLPSSINLRSLRRLQLSHIELNGNDIERLTSGCPVLEWMSLSDCNRGALLNITIRNPRLKGVKVFDSCSSGEIFINAPHLPLLEFGNRLRVVFTRRRLAPLTNLKLDLVDYSGFVRLVNRLQPIKLEISEINVKDIYSELKDNRLNSSKTRCLYLTARLPLFQILNAARLFILFLHNVENLKISILPEMVIHVMQEGNSFQKTKKSLEFLKQKIGADRLKSLKVVAIEGLFHEESFIRNDEIEVLRILLNGLTKLDRMTLRAKRDVCHYESDTNRLEMLYCIVKKLLSFPRASPKLEIDFC